MKVSLSRNKDFWSGMMFIVIGAVAMFIARDYKFGSTLRMGPGFFPVILGGILVLIGLSVMVSGLRRSEAIQGSWSVRAMILMPLSLVLFGLLMELAGFIPSLAALIFVAASSGREFRFIEVFLVCLLLIGLSVGVFIWGLNLPYPLLKGF